MIWHDERLAHIDGLGGIAVLMVVVCHAWHLAGFPGYIVHNAGSATIVLASPRDLGREPVSGTLRVLPLVQTAEATGVGVRELVLVATVRTFALTPHPSPVLRCARRVHGPGLP